MENKVKVSNKDFFVVGNVKVNDKTFVIGETTSNNKLYNRMNVIVDVLGEGTFVELFGMEQKILYANGSKVENGREQRDFTNSIQIKWDDRFDEDKLKNVNGQCFFTAEIVEDSKKKIIKKKFLSEYDFVEYLSENLKDGMKIYARGEISFEPYLDTENNVKTGVKKRLKNIYLVKEDDEKRKPQKKFSLGLLTSSNAISEDDIANAKKGLENVIMKAFVPVRGLKIGDTYSKEALLVPILLQVDSSKPNAFEKLASKYLIAEDGFYNQFEIEGEFVQAGEVMDISEDDLMKELDEDTKMLLELGELSIEDLMHTIVGNGNNSREIMRHVKFKTIKNKETNIPTVKFLASAFKDEEVSHYGKKLLDDEDLEEDKELLDAMDDDIAYDEDEDLDSLFDDEELD